MKAICPATLDVLLNVLSGYYGTRANVAPSNAIRDQKLRRLVLRCVVQIVHVIHHCNPDQVGAGRRRYRILASLIVYSKQISYFQRQVEVGAVIEGFFGILLIVCTKYVAQPGLTLMIDMLGEDIYLFNIYKYSIFSFTFVFVLFSDGIHLMFNCTDRLSLQVVIVAEGCFETLIDILQKTKVTIP